MDDDDPGILFHVSQLKKGMTLKSKNEKGVMARADVVDLIEMKPGTEDGKPSVKLHWWGTKSKDDKWVMVEDCRLIRQFTVEWQDILTKLPLAQDPSSRAIRKEAFESWNTAGAKGKGASLSITELRDGVQSSFGENIGADIEEVAKAVDCSWKVSRNLAPSKKKSGAKRVDLKEFHAFIIAFRCYLELAELFEYIDHKQEDDQMLSLRECHKGMKQLAKWGVGEDQLREVFVDKSGNLLEPEVPKWKFVDFAKFCTERRWSEMTLDLELDTDDEDVELDTAKVALQEAAGLNAERRRQGQELLENRKSVMAAFKRWDLNYDGKISEDELVQALTEVDPNMSGDVARRIAMLADANEDGAVDYEEFCLWVFAPSIDDA